MGKYQVKKVQTIDEADTRRKYVVPRLLQAGWPTARARELRQSLIDAPG
jgi:hypothetical protein